MPKVFPFRAVQFAPPPPSSPRGGRVDVSTLVAPPYDVLDTAGKARLLARDKHNIVAIDLPHTPAKELGPPEAYESAAATYKTLFGNGTLKRSAEPALFAYRQTWTQPGRTPADPPKKFQRSGMACCVEAVPFGPREGGGILPHEETFSGPKEDRLALMKATKMQLSPIFGLHADDQGLATALIQKVMNSGRVPDQSATTDDGTLHEVWNITDAPTIKAYQDALAGEDVFIADGHHRYNTGLTYLGWLESQSSVGGGLPPDHPARRSMMVLVGMNDPGLIIWPTHRVLGGMKGYTFKAFAEAAKDMLSIRPAGPRLAEIEREMSQSTLPPPPLPRNVLGLCDCSTGECYTATFKTPDPLKAAFPVKPQAWRDLDVALIQHAIVEQICQAKLNGGNPVKWAFPHTIKEVEDIARGVETGAGGGKTFGEGGAQLAIIVRPTPLRAVKDVSRANQLMPQKSTFFYPKLATGLFMNELAVGG